MSYFAAHFVILCRSCFGNINFFGGPSSMSVKASAKLQEIESANEDAMFVFISDLWLDDVKVCCNPLSSNYITTTIIIIVLIVRLLQI